MRDGRKCGGCGARVTRSEARFCEYCGAELPAPKPEKPAQRSEAEKLAAAFQALADDPGYSRVMSRTPSASGPLLGYVGGAVSGAIFLVVSLFIFRGFKSVGDGAPFPFVLVPILFVGVGAGILIFSASKAVKFSGSPLQRHRARVAGERTHVSGGGRNNSARTSYYVTLEFENGHREEFKASGRTVGELSEGDMGVAYLKGGHLIDFSRLTRI